MPEFVHRDEFDGYITRHEADGNAHGEARRRQSDKWEDEIKEMRSWQRAHDIAHATAAGELSGVTKTLRVGFSVVGLLIVAFGSGILAVVIR